MKVIAVRQDQELVDIDGERGYIHDLAEDIEHPPASIASILARGYWEYLPEPRVLTAHLPGQHDQSDHNPHKGSGEKEPKREQKIPLTSRVRNFFSKVVDQVRYLAFASVVEVEHINGLLEAYVGMDLAEATDTMTNVAEAFGIPLGSFGGKIQEVTLVSAAENGRSTITRRELQAVVILADYLKIEVPPEIRRALSVVAHLEGQHDQQDHNPHGTGRKEEPSGGKGDPAQDAPIKVGGDIKRAAQLLAEGKRVELDQPREVSTLLSELAARVKEAKEAGKDAPNYNLCGVSVAGTNLFCQDSKDIPRIQMPQLKGIPQEGSQSSLLQADKRGEVDITDQFVRHLASEGFKLTGDVERADMLRATQNELKGGQVAGMYEFLQGGGKFDPGMMLVSKDNYIIDGHHRWAATVAHDTIDNQLGAQKISVIRIDADIGTLLHLSKEFATEWGIPQIGVSGGTFAEKPKPQAASAFTDRLFDSLKQPILDADRPLPFVPGPITASFIGHARWAGQIWEVWDPQPLTAHLPGEHDQSDHNPHEGGGKKDEPRAEHLRAEAAAEFKRLRGEWARVNNELLGHMDRDPDSPEVKAKVEEMKHICKVMQRLEADPGTLEGIGLPGGPRDVLIVGAGPGGLQAAIAAGTEGLDTLVVDTQTEPGGQAKYSSRIENYAGFPPGTPGSVLAEDMFSQAERHNAETRLGTEVVGIEYDEATGMKTVTFANGETEEARTVILAGGVAFDKLEFPGSDNPNVIVANSAKIEEVGADKPVVIIGGSNGAAQAALGAARTASEVTVLSRSPIEDNMSEYQITQLQNHPKINVIEGKEHQIASYLDGKVTTQSGQVIEGVAAVGIFIGGKPANSWIPASIDRASDGKIITDRDYETTMPGVYAIGDLNHGSPPRIAGAVGDGISAVASTWEYFEELEKIRERRGTTAAAGPEKGDKLKPIPKDDPRRDEWDKLLDRLFELDAEHPYLGTMAEVDNPLVAHLPGQHDQEDHNPYAAPADPWGGKHVKELGGRTPEQIAELTRVSVREEAYRYATQPDAFDGHGPLQGEELEGYVEDTANDAAAQAFGEARAIEERMLGVRELTSDERWEIESYSNWGFFRVNESLREGRVPLGIPVIDSAFGAMSPTRDPTTLYRGIDWDPELSAALQPGAVFEDKGYISTSSRELIAQQHAGPGDSGQAGLVVSIEVPAGVRMIDVGRSRIESGVGTGTEQEHLLPRGSRFEVLSREGNNIQSRLVGYPGQEDFAEFVYGQPTERDRLYPYAASLTAHLPGQHDQADHNPHKGSKADEPGKGHKEAVSRLATAGIRTKSVDELRGGLRRYLDRELQIQAPKWHPDFDHAADGIIKGFESMRTHPELTKVISEIEERATVVFAHYEPAGAMMTTIGAPGMDPLFLVNTAFEHGDLATTQAGSYSGLRQEMEYQDSDSREQAIQRVYEVSMAHEASHAIDNMTGFALTDSFEATVQVLAQDMEPEEVFQWAEENISEYATFSSREAAAEAFSRLVMNDLPDDLVEWGKYVKERLAEES